MRCKPELGQQRGRHLMLKSLRTRLQRVEMDAVRRCTSKVPHLYVACVDEDGLVVDDGGEAVRPWIGRHYSELPQPVSVAAGIDPRLVLGLDIAAGNTRSTGDEEASRENAPAATTTRTTGSQRRLSGLSLSARVGEGRHEPDLHPRQRPRRYNPPAARGTRRSESLCSLRLAAGHRRGRRSGHRRRMGLPGLRFGVRWV